MTALLIFPNQLYENSKIDPLPSHTFMLEEPIYFYDRTFHPYRPNKVKIAYMRACMRYYFDHNIKGPKTYISYEELLKRPTLLKEFNKQYAFICYDPTDHNITRKYKKLNITFLDSLNFLFTPTQLEKGYHITHQGSTRHASFYTWSKRTLGITELQGIPNLDRENRKPPTIQLNSISDPNPFPSNSYYEEAIAYSNRPIFKDHIGDAAQALHLYPINSKDAYMRFKNIFLREHFHAYGPFQDAIIKDKFVLHHSFISAALNIGLLDPKKLLDLSREMFGGIPINSFEGFLRQLIGFREYYRYLYVFKGQQLLESGPLDRKHQIPITAIPALYKGTTGITPFDNEFHKAVKYGYAHHIVRLMVFLNFLLLNHIKAHDIYKWFVEIVSIDAYPWVMVSNIYAMGYFYKGAMSRRYLSSSNYIRKMTNYEKGPWCQVWDDLYRSYISKN